MYHSPNTVRVIKPRILRWVGHVARMEEEILHERDLQEGLVGDGRTILEWILKNSVTIRGTELIRLRIGLLETPCECGIEPPGFISHGVSENSNIFHDIGLK